MQSDKLRISKIEVKNERGLLKNFVWENPLQINLIIGREQLAIHQLISILCYFKNYSKEEDLKTGKTIYRHMPGYSTDTSINIETYKKPFKGLGDNYIKDMTIGKFPNQVLEDFNYLKTCWKKGTDNDDSIFVALNIERDLHPDIVCQYIDLINIYAHGMDAQFFVSTNSYSALDKFTLLAVKEKGLVSLTCIDDQNCDIGSDEYLIGADLHEGNTTNSIVYNLDDLYNQANDLFFS